jgi:hypothetical protein
MSTPSTSTKNYNGHYETACETTKKDARLGQMRVNAIRNEMGDIGNDV